MACAKACIWTAIERWNGWTATELRSSRNNPTPVGATEPKLWFVNLGAYNPNAMAEQHHFDVVVARSAAAAKASAKRSWLRGLQQVHKDDLHDLRQDPALDDLLPITGNGQWSLRISPIEGGDDPEPVPDWFGYRLL